MRIVVIGGGENGAGASKVTQDVTNIIAQLPATIEALTGIDLVEALSELTGLKPEEAEIEVQPSEDGDQA